MVYGNTSTYGQYGPGTGSMSIYGPSSQFAYAYGIPQGGQSQTPTGMVSHMGMQMSYPIAVQNGYRGPPPASSTSSGSSSSSSYSGPSQAAQTFLNSVVSGQTLPFDQATQSNMLTNASNMNAAAERALNDRMTSQAATGGASMTDPSFQSAQRNAMSQRQGQNAQAANEIGMQANRGNFDARLRAAGVVSEIEQANAQRAQAAQQQLASGAFNSAPASGSRISGYGSAAQANGTYGGTGVAYQPPKQQPYQRQTTANMPAQGGSALGYRY